MLNKISSTLRSFYRTVNPRYAARRKRLKTLDTQQVFEDIFEKEHWGEKSSSVSGSGSTIEATRLISQRLPGLMKELDIKVLLDAPCGDFGWMKDVSLGIERYIGADIVPALVDEVQNKYAAPGREFMVLNLLADPLPECDMVFCRDCMLHLAYQDQRKLLENLKASNFKYVMLSTFPKAQANRDIVTGEARQINLRLPPLGLPEPMLSVPDNNPKEPNRAMGVWSREQLMAWSWQG